MAYQPITIQLPSPVVFLELSKCLWCYALVAKEDAWRHDAWHTGVDQQPAPTPAHVLDPDDADVMRHHIDGLYILLGEDPPYNAELPTGPG